MIYACCDERRRSELSGKPLNGIDYLEVLDLEAPTPADRQRVIHLYFVNSLSGASLTSDNLHMTGGERITDLQITAASSTTNLLTVEVDRPGDFSIYTLSLVRDPQHLDQPPPGFDPALSSIDFSFKVECPSPFDCKQDCFCQPELLAEPEIDYLAKDYASFRRLILDRMAQLMPTWKERNASDLGIALVELMAYVGDHLSYQQDAIGTEAYLDTARRRVSVRRHAVLVDYFMHDGCNARTWVQIEVGSDLTPGGGVPALAKGTALTTRVQDQPLLLPLNDPVEMPRALDKADVIFETMQAVKALLTAHNKIHFYTWSDRECCLPEGSRNATLQGTLANLKVGEVLIFEEVLGPKTGRTADSDLRHRHPVRLTSVDWGTAADPKVDPLTNETITEIEWGSQDALPFPLCISSRTDASYGGKHLDNVSVARGNIVLADHGRTLEAAPIGTVPRAHISHAADLQCDICDTADPSPVHGRFRPRLSERPLTHAAPYQAAYPAKSAFLWKMRQVLPQISLEGVENGQTDEWETVRDLLASGPNANEFVVEIESDQEASLRFGDDRHGSRPAADTVFQAAYRIGNGIDGNIGAEALVHIASDHSEIIAVRNLLPAVGGVEPETIDEVRRNAPQAFLTQERAVTEDDYAGVTEKIASVQQAEATFRWTGSWHTVFLTPDRVGGPMTSTQFPQLKENILKTVERYRMAGYDLSVDRPRYVSLEIDMTVCVKADYFRSDIQEALLEVFGSRDLPDGRRGVFHPDNFTFGQTVYLSPLYAAAQAVEGVDSIEITLFQRQNAPGLKPLQEGKLKLERLEIARLDNDPNFAERGVFRLSMEGGK